MFGVWHYCVAPRWDQESGVLIFGPVVGKTRHESVGVVGRLVGSTVVWLINEWLKGNLEGAVWLT